MAIVISQTPPRYRRHACVSTACLGARELSIADPIASMRASAGHRGYVVDAEYIERGAAATTGNPPQGEHQPK